MGDDDFFGDSPDKSEMQRDELQLALHRDRLVHSLRGSFRAAPSQLRAAGRRLDARVRADIHAMHEEKRRHVRLQLSLLPVAKRLVLEPESMNAGSGIAIDVKKPPKDFDVLGVSIDPMPVWIHETYRAAGRMDHHILDMVQNLAGHLRNAQAGAIADYKLPHGIDLRRTSPLKAYVFAISKLWSKGQYSEADVRRSLDPKRVRNTAATPEAILLDVTREVAYDRITRLVPLEEWWDIALVCGLLLDPDFDARRVCKTRLAPWRGDEGDYDREAILNIWFETDNRYDLDGLWNWTERAELNLAHSLRTRQKPRRLPPSRKLSDQASPSGASGESPDHGADRAHPFVPDPSKPVDPAELNAVRIDVVSQRVLWRDRTCHFAGKTQWALIKLLHTNTGTQMSEDAIRQRLWPNRSVGRTSVASLVNTVRDRLKQSGIPREVVTATRGWYNLNSSSDGDLTEKSS